MDIWVVASVAWVSFVLLRLILVPWVDRRADTSPKGGGVRAAAMSSLVGILSFSSLMVAIGASASLIVLAFVNATGGATLQEARDAMARLKQIQSVVSRMSAGVGLAVTSVLVGMLAYHAYRSGKKRLAAFWQERIRQEVSRLRNGDLGYRAPTAAMRRVAARIEALRGQIDSTQDDEYRTELDGVRRKLKSQYEVMDVERRIDWHSEQASVGASGWGRALLFVSSVGMLRSLQGLRRVAAAAGLVLLLPASMTIGVPSVRNAVARQLVDLETTIDRLELELDRDRVAEDFGGIERDPEPVELDSEDEFLVDAIASMFESEVVFARYLNDLERRPAQRDVAREKQRALARNAIVNASSGARSALSGSSLDPLEQRVVQLVGATETHRRRPVTTYGQRFRQGTTGAVARMSSETRADLRNKVDAYVRPFGQVENPLDVRAMVLADLLGQAIGGVETEGWIAALLKTGAGGFAGDVVEAAFKAESQRFLVALAREPDVRSALRRLSDTRPPLTSRAMADVRSSVKDVPNLESISVEPGAVRQVPRPDFDGAWTYDDLFPGELREQPGEDGRRRFRLARSYRDLHHSALVGGVLIGRAPESVATLTAERFAWRPMTDRGAALRLLYSDGTELGLGYYDPAVLHSALIYAADGRVATVTIVEDPRSGDPLILVHPALAGTALGCSAIDLDLLAELAKHREPSLSELQEAAVSDVLGQHWSYKRAWAIRLLALSSLPSTQRQYSDLDVPLRGELEEQARTILRGADSRAREPVAREFGFLTSRPDVYDQRLVADLLGCGTAERNSEVLRCLRGRATEERYGADLSASWASPFLKARAVSGVREQPWAVDDRVTFLSSSRPLGPFRFFVHIVFSKWHEEGDRALGEEEDVPSHELVGVGQALMKEITLWRDGEDGEEVGKVLARMADFVYLQRLFRAVLDGHLILTGMDLAELAQLATEAGKARQSEEPVCWGGHGDRGRGGIWSAP